MKKIITMAIALMLTSQNTSAQSFTQTALSDPQLYQANCQMQLRWAEAMLDSIDIKSARHILDIGSGDGKITSNIALKNLNAKVIGLDISSEMVHFANRTYGNQRVFFINGDAQKLPFYEQFDVVVSFSTIHRLLHPQLAFKEIYKTLKVGGTFIAAFPASGSPIMSQAIATIDSKPEWREYFSKPDRKNYALNDQKIREWLDEEGFIVVKSQTKWEDEIFSSRENFRDLLRATFSQRDLLPPEKELPFFEEIVEEYLRNSPLDQKGQVHFYFNRIEVVAFKMPQAKL